MAIFVVLATITGVVIVALTTSSGDSFEDAGRSDVGEAGTSSGFAEGSRRPNEIRDPALESMGIPGEIQDLPPALASGDFQGKTSKNIGYRPYCPPWEYLTKGPNEKGEYEYDPTAATEANIGGTEGAGGVYSSKPGCFAPCYLNFYLNFGSSLPKRQSGHYHLGNHAREFRLLYFDDNRNPDTAQFRLGVNHRRRPVNEYAGQMDLWLWSRSDVVIFPRNRDGKPFLNIQDGRGPRLGPGMPDLAPAQLVGGVPAVYIPNFMSEHPEPPGGVTARNGSNWEDENWEYRADPISRTCTIVNVTQNDRLVCSSEWDDCDGPS